MRFLRILVFTLFVFGSWLFFVSGIKSQSLPADLFNDPRFMVVSEDFGRLYVLNNKNQELVILDIKSRSLIKKIKLEAGGLAPCCSIKAAFAPSIFFGR